MGGHWISAIIFVISVSLPQLACTPMQPDSLGVRNEMLAPCPKRLNCVCSDESESTYRISAYHSIANTVGAWQELRRFLGSLPRTRVVRATDAYLHVEARSRVFGFVDDVEFHLREFERTIAVRSASRTGYWDFGVNRRRIESIREHLRQRGIIR